MSKLTSIKYCLIIIGAFSLQSCMVAAIGAGIGAVKYGNAKEEEASAECKKSYNIYLKNIQRINNNKVKSNQKQEKMLTLEEYCPEN